MQAIILAAGMGKRLKNLTKNNTKCMVEVNGVTLIERLLRQLEKIRLSRIVIVIGYEGKKLMDFVSLLDIETPVVYVTNPIYDKTNNIYSLYLAKDYLCEDDTLLFESDLIVEDAVIRSLLDDPRETLALVDKYESWMDGTCFVLSDGDDIVDFIPGKKLQFDKSNKYYKTVNIYKFSKHFSVTHYVPFLDAYCAALGRNQYYEQVLKVITMLDDPEIKAKKLNGELWYEIDDIQDLDIASTIFTEDDEEKTELLQRRFGGYWRYPGLLDFCYLVNPYYPPKRMLDEIKANFELLVTSYPSGMRVNSLLVAKNFGVDIANIVVGNGAAELIRSLTECLHGKIGIIRPTFEEYPNRLDPERLVEYYPSDFSYNADDLIGYFENTEIGHLVLINPDNPSGNYIPFDGLKKLAEWALQRNVRLILDESFADFADEENNTFITQNLLDGFPNVCVVKSISKSYGVPGLRLGVMASGDKELISHLKKDVSIWNINSFAEFYLQIAEKYNSDYISALEKFREERKRFLEELKKIEDVTVYPTQANFVMLELRNGLSAKKLTVNLLKNHSILIKDLTAKCGENGRQFVRIAIRNAEENATLLSAFCKEIERERENG